MADAEFSFELDRSGGQKLGITFALPDGKEDVQQILVTDVLTGSLAARARAVDTNVPNGVICVGDELVRLNGKIASKLDLFSFQRELGLSQVTLTFARADVGGEAKQFVDQGRANQVATTESALPRRSRLSATGAHAVAERTWLAAFHHETGGPTRWRRKDRWLTPSPSGEWYGVGTSNSGRINAVCLDENGLTGGLRASARFMCGGVLHPCPVNLVKVSLCRNELCGEVPGALFTPPLAQCYLSYNQFTGALPPQLFRCTSLAVLMIRGNQLDGTIPDSISRLSLLRGLDLSRNQFDGVLPPAMGQLALLECLDVSGNRFSGPLPSALSKCSKLEFFDVSHNSFSGNVPACVGSLPQLRLLDVSDNCLQGDLPPLAGCKNLARDHTFFGKQRMDQASRTTSLGQRQQQHCPAPKTPPPCSTRVSESVRLPCPIERAWALLRNLNFSWWQSVDAHASAPLVDAEVGLCGALAQVVFRDAAQWCLQLLEHSELAHTLVFDIVDASPALQCMSQLHAITLHRVTSTDETVVEWVTDFSSDANAETIVDARYKRLEALDDLFGAVIESVPPSVTRICESICLPCPISKAWAWLCALDFGWWRSVDAHASAPLVDAEVGLCGALAQVVFRDAAQWCLQLLEHSELAHTLVFDIVDASPALQCMSQLHAITLHRVTSTDETVVEWVTDFSSDANAETIVDARYKRLEALDDMRACVIAADAASAPPHRLRWPRQLYTT